MKKTDFALPDGDQRNCHGGERGPIGLENVAVIGTNLSVFICPSAPGSAMDRRYRNTITKVLPPGSIVLNQGTSGLFHPPENVIYDLTLEAAPSDYIVTTGVGIDFATLAFGNQDYSQIDLKGILRPSTPKSPIRNKSSGVTDGLSNTFLMGERTGGSKLYVGRGELKPIDSVRMSNGGGWGDFLNGDGSISLLSESIASQSLVGQISSRNAEIVTGD